MPASRFFPHQAIAAALALLLAPASALCFTVGDLNYEFQSGSDTEVYVSGLANSSATNITIPSTVQYDNQTYRVTTIGDRAFMYCVDLSSVTIPDSVTSIGDKAFYACGSMEAFTVASGNPAFKSVNGLLLTKDGKTLLHGVNGEVAIPNGITSIGDYAFFLCRGLTNVTIPDNVMSIGDSAFSDCSALTSVTIPDSVTSIGQDAFSGCSGLTSVTIPASVTCIDIYAFYNCGGLTNVIIPDSVTSIGSYAFYGCSGLTGVTIPASVTRIGDGAFCNCGSMKAFSVADGNPAFKSVNGLLLTKNGKALLHGVNGDVAIPDGVISIGREAFYGCSGLTSVTIPESVTSIESLAFSDCSGLNAFSVASGNPAYQSVSGLLLTQSGKKLLYGVNGSVVIPESVTSIGWRAFSGCSGLTSVTIPDSVTSIGDYAFYGCRGLTSISIPNNVASIGAHSFYGCSGLTNVTIPDSVMRIEWEAFYGCSGLTNVTIGASVTSIGDFAFCRCSGLTSISIPNNVTSIWAHSFHGCSGLTSVIIPDSVTGIGDEAFFGCSGLTSMTILGNVTYDWSYYVAPFMGCTNLATLVLGEKMTKIGAYMFYGCSGLANVYIPDSVTTIGESAFAGCSGLKTLSVPGAWEGTGMLDDVWGDYGKPEGCVVVYRSSETFPPAQNEAEVAATLAGAADGRLGERIRTVEEYEAFRAWMTTNGLDARAVRASAHAWISYALRAEKLFENEPEIVLAGVSAGSGVAMEVGVTVKDGGTEVTVDPSKVAGMFEATGDLRDWEGEAKILATATPTGSEGASMRFEVVPGDGTAREAFLRIAP